VPLPDVDAHQESDSELDGNEDTDEVKARDEVKIAE
jgi:hypothetical protein